MKHCHIARLFVIGLSLTVLQPEPAFAQDMGGAWQQIDRNADGEIDRDEFAAATQAQFQTLDANRDGVITAAEFDAARLAQFQAIDADHNGRITRGEMRSMLISKLMH